MGVSVWIFALLFTISAAVAVPTRESRTSFHHHHEGFSEAERGAQVNLKDMLAEPSAHAASLVTPNKPHSRVIFAEADTSEAIDDHSVELVGGSQTFFPSFANLFENRQNNLRLGFGNQEAAFSQRPNSYRSLFNYPVFSSFKNGFESFGKQEQAPPPQQQSAPLIDQSASILGSGNFGIIRGGTFHAHNDDDEYDGFASFYNNGHGRPSVGLGYIANPRPNYNQDQFANFRDFADINTPSNSAYSNYVVVYANKNATLDEVGEETKKVVSKPKNIIETLDRLEDEVKVPKISKAKAKLALTKQKMLNKKEQWKKTNSKYFSPKFEIEEPLLALS